MAKQRKEVPEGVISALRSGGCSIGSYENTGRSLGAAANQHALRRVLNQMRRGFVSAIALLLCLLVVGMLVGREKCRLGNVRWQICAWMGIPHAGGPFPSPQTPDH